MAGTEIEFWRSFFRDSEHDLWTIIDKALTVAALDSPDKLRARRDGYAEKLFAGPVSWSEDVFMSGSQGQEATETGDAEEIVDMRSGNRDVASSHEDGEVDEEMKQVLEMKELLSDHAQTDDDVLECLKRLNNFQLSIETLKTTGIGKPVNALRKHSSVQIKSLAKKLVRSWKAVADEWAKSLDDVQVSEPAETNDEECGLQAPPVDEGELLAALEMPQFMDFMDNELATPDMIDESPLVQVSYTSSRASHSPPYNNLVRRERKETGLTQQTKSRYPSGVWNSTDTHRKDRPLHEQKATLTPQYATNKRTTTTQNLSQKLPVEDYSIKDRLAAAKRKLQEGYQQAETAKKQRTVQVMDLVDLPKGSGPKAAKRAPPAGAAKPVHHNNNSYYNNNRTFGKRW